MTACNAVDTVFVDGATARAAWSAWTDALGARVDHELECFQGQGGCDTRDSFCLIGRDLNEAEQAAHDAYRKTTQVVEVAA